MSGLRRKSIATLLRQLRSPDAMVRRTAAGALGGHGSDEAIRPLVAALADPDSGVRGLAALGLKRLGAKQASSDIAALLSADQPKSVMVSAICALGELQAVEGVPALIGALDDAMPFVREMAARALGEIGDKQAAEALSILTNDLDYYVRFAAAVALDAIGESSGRKVIERLRHDTNAPAEARMLAHRRLLGNDGETAICEEGRVQMRASRGGAGEVIYQIKVTLNGSEPGIWRRILVTGGTTLSTLHSVLQFVMGWSHCHLHEFTVAGTEYGMPGPDRQTFSREVADERRAKLLELVPGEGFSFGYVYDFGDNWEHELVVEKILEPEPGRCYPACIGGERACPPEDCGGIWGYYGLLEALRDPKHPEHEDLTEWVGGGFDPDEFDLEAANR